MMDQNQPTTTSASKSAENRGRAWTEEELGTFLDVWGSEEILSKMDGTSRNSLVFRTIVEKMKDMGYERTSKEIQNKMKNLKRDYRRVIDHNKRSGNDTKSMLHKEKLDIILGDRPSAEPHHTVQSGSNNTDEMSSDDDDQDESFDSQQECDLEDSESVEELTSSSMRSSADSGNESSQNESFEEVVRPSTSRKRPSTTRRNDCRKRTKTSRMKETMSVMSECLDEQLKKFSKSFQEEERKFAEEQKNWEREFQKNMAQENDLLKKTMESINDLLKSMTNRQNFAVPSSPFPFNSPGGPSTHHPWHSTPHPNQYSQHQQHWQSPTDSRSSLHDGGDNRDYRFYQQL